MRKFEIDRSRLIYGRFMTDDGCGCVVGLYLTACGADTDMLTRQRTVSGLDLHGLPEECRWIVDWYCAADTGIARYGHKLAEISDTVLCFDINKRLRPDAEKNVIEIFAKHNVEASFVGAYR